MINFIIILGLILIWKVWLYIGIYKYLKIEFSFFCGYYGEIPPYIIQYTTNKLLKQVKYSLFFNQFTLPEAKGKTITFRRYNDIK